jgi:CheY-specific phosphatase CheX
MLNAVEVNTIVESTLAAIECVPKMPQLSIGPPEAMPQPGAYGSLILGALFTGGLEGKLTMTLEWVTVFALAEALTNTRIEGFNEEAQQALESLFQAAVQGMADRFAELGVELDIRVMPTLVDTSVLLGEEGQRGSVKVPILLESGTINLFLAFK